MGEPAGWFRDPAGVAQWRYWDGMSWTARVEDGPAHDVDSDTAESHHGRSRAASAVPAQPTVLFDRASPPIYCTYCGVANTLPIWCFDEYRFEQEGPSRSIPDCCECGEPPVSVDELIMNIFGSPQFTVRGCACGTTLYVGRRYCFKCGRGPDGHESSG